MVPRTEIKAILFDMDGVLMDVSCSYRKAIEETVYHFTGRTIQAHTIQRYKNQGGFNDDWVLTHAIIGDSGMEVSLSRVISEFQRRYRGERWDGFIAQETPLIGTPILEKLLQQGYVMGVVTGRPEAEAAWTIERMGWKRYFPLLVAREMQGHRGKPDPFPLQHALGVLNAVGVDIKPEAAVYLGDSVDDMVAARAAGMWAVGFIPPYLDRIAHETLLRDRGAHAILDITEALPDLVGDLSQYVDLALLDNEESL